MAHHCSWFGDVFDRMNKDSAEVKWRQLSECETPETAPLPDVLDQRCFPTGHYRISFIKLGNSPVVSCFYFEISVQ